MRAWVVLAFTPTDRAPPTPAVPPPAPVPETTHAEENSSAETSRLPLLTAIFARSLVLVPSSTYAWVVLATAVAAMAPPTPAVPPPAKPAVGATVTSDEAAVSSNALRAWIVVPLPTFAVVFLTITPTLPVPPTPAVPPPAAASAVSISSVSSTAFTRTCWSAPAPVLSSLILALRPIEASAPLAMTFADTVAATPAVPPPAPAITVVIRFSRL